MLIVKLNRFMYCGHVDDKSEQVCVSVWKGKGQGRWRKRSIYTSQEYSFVRSAVIYSLTKQQEYKYTMKNKNLY